jgi:hypothetical protein
MKYPADVEFYKCSCGGITHVEKLKFAYVPRCDKCGMRFREGVDWDWIIKNQKVRYLLEKKDKIKKSKSEIEELLIYLENQESEIEINKELKRLSKKR